MIYLRRFCFQLLKYVPLAECEKEDGVDRLVRLK
jgi:hypothetical protein